MKQTREKEQQDYENTVSAIYKHRTGETETEVQLEVAAYKDNGTMAVMLNSRFEDFFGEYTSVEQIPFEVPYAVVTVNLPESERLAPNEQFVDSNNLPDIGRWLVQNNIAIPTEHVAESSHCTYRAYAFNLPERLIKKIVNSREDSIAKRLICEIKASGMKAIPKQLANKPVFQYVGYTFIPAYNFEDLGWDTNKNEQCTHLRLPDPCLDYLNHLYSYKEFYKKASKKKDIFYCVETQKYYCPGGESLHEIAIR